MNIKIKILRPIYLLYIVLALIVMICSGSAFSTLFNVSSYLVLVGVFVGLLLLVFKVDKRKNNVINIWVAMFILSLVFSMPKSISDLVSCLSICLIILLSMLIVYLFNCVNILHCFVNIMFILTIVGTIAFFVDQQTNILKFLPIYKNVNGWDYRFGFLYNSICAVSDRNVGFFWEPGVFATFIGIASIFDIIVKQFNVKQIIRIFIYIISLFVTTSSAGIILALLVITFLFTMRLKNSKKLFLKILFVLILITILIIALNFEKIIMNTALSGNVYFQKILFENVRESSRIEAIKSNLDIFLSNPLFGVGPSAMRMLSNSEINNDTSTTTYLMGEFGILGLSYTILIIRGVLKQKSLGMMSMLTLMLVLLFIVNKEPHVNFLFTWIIIILLNTCDINKSIIKRRY